MPSTDGNDDLVRVFGPAEGLRALIILFDEAVDGGLEGDNGVEHAAFEPTVGQLGEETLNGVDPRRRGRREVEGEPLVRPEPCDDFGVLVGRVLVEHDVNLLVGRNLVSMALRKWINS